MKPRGYLVCFVSLVVAIVSMSLAIAALSITAETRFEQIKRTNRVYNAAEQDGRIEALEAEVQTLTRAVKALIDDDGEGKK